MALVYLDRAQETSTTEGSGAYDLDGAVLGYQDFSGVGNGNTCYYAATNGRDWEVGLGTYVLASSRLIRTSILAGSNGTSPVNWRAGTKYVWIDYPAEVINNTVAAISIATDNGFAGTVSAGPNPVITLETTVTGILEGDGTAISAVNGFVPTSSGGEANVADRSALSNVDTSRNTVAYLAEGGRAGWFQWSSANQSAGVTLDPSQGVYVASSSDPTGASGAWVRVNQSPLTPFMFGAVGDGATDDAAPLNAFFQFISLVQSDASVWGNFAIGSVVYIGDAAAESATKHVDWNAQITTTFTSTGEALRFRNQTFVSHSGFIGLTCGSSDWTSRRQYDGIIAENCSRTSWDDISVRGVKRNGFRFEAGAGNLSVVDKLSVRDCGSGLGSTSAGGVTSNCSSHVQTGSSNSTNQREVLTVDSVPAEVAVGDFIQFDGRPYLITAFDAGALTVTVYPWLLNAAASGTVRWFMGAGLFAVGSNASIWEFGIVDARTCAVGFKCHALYPPEIGEMHCGSGGIGVSIGTNATAGSEGGWIGQFYQEGGGAVAYGLVQVTTATISFGIGSGATALFSTWFKLNPNTGTVDGAAPIDVNLFNIDGFSYGKTGQAQNSSGSTFTLTTQPQPSRVTVRTRDTLTVTLQETADINRLWGYDTMFVLATGSGTRGQPTGTWTFSPEVGYTVNGGASAAFSGFNDPVLFAVHLNVGSLDWRVTQLTQRLPSVSADKGNAAATLTVAGSDRVNVWNTPLSADRAVTLSTSGASNGNNFRIVRTAAATGAFNLNVGTGPLKALAVGQWCDVSYDGAAWFLTAFGSL